MRLHWALLLIAALVVGSVTTGYAFDQTIASTGASHAAVHVGSVDVPHDDACNDEHANPGHACCASALVHCMTAMVGDASSSANVSPSIAAFAVSGDERFRTAGVEAETPPPRL